jgi:hypothetical protein
MGERLERRASKAIAARIAIVVVLSVVVVSMAGGGVVAAASSEPPLPPVTDNEFIPQDRDLGECISALPKPGCGSDAQSDWHQELVLGVMVAGMVFVGWRIVRGVRRREPNHADVDTPST